MLISRRNQKCQKETQKITESVSLELSCQGLSLAMRSLGSASRGETVEEACMVHGIEVEELLEELNKQIASSTAATTTEA